MNKEAESEIENSEEHEEESSNSIKERIYKYRMPAAIILVFIIAALITNTVNTSISGAMVADVKLECQEKVSQLETQTQTLIAEKSNLELENERLERKVENFENENSLFDGILTGLNNEKIETLTTPYGFKITWDKYVITKPGEELVWFAKINNIGSSTKSFFLDLRLKSVYNNVFERDPATGSLTLAPGSSGTLDVELIPKAEGYAIFMIYVNNNYVGDLIVFSLQ